MPLWPPPTHGLDRTKHEQNANNREKSEQVMIVLMIYNRGQPCKGRKIYLVRRRINNPKVHILMSFNLNGLERLCVGLNLALLLEEGRKVST